MDHRIVSRVLVPLACVSLLLLLTAAGAAWYARLAQQRVSAMLNSNVASVRAARDLESRVRDVDAGLDRFLITGDRQHLEAVRPLRQLTLDALAEAESVAFTKEEQALMRRVRAGCERLFAEYDRVFHGPPGAVPRAELAELAAIPEKEILEPAKEYARLNEEALAQSGQTSEEMTGLLTVVFLAIGACGAGGGLLGGWLIATGVRRGMLRTEERLQGTVVRLSAVVPTGAHAGDAAERLDESVSALLDRFRQVERDALRAEQLAWVGQMAAGIAHEIRNPLMAIKILIQTAADPLGLSPFRAKDLAVIEREIGRLEHTVTGFLDFARPPRPERQATDLRSLLEQAVAGLQARADRQKVALGIEVPAEPVTLLVDPNQFGQVVYNLLYNAIDAQPGGGRVRISVEAATREGGGPELVLRVADEGAGLPAAVGERIFDPFVSTKETGLGLGLSICRRIVEAHGGTIRAGSPPAGGAVFTVRLPLLDALESGPGTGTRP
ncbi:Sporulation kinase A [Gemmata obscuriglobus]|uniref:histidine kinase n=1 Tax=Gemmata obscuriglobus TaxID=114 RepID=A0A2Z3H036_9BACT|nr:ATP-binding protein [Gemmata obscuriglobus]AWM39373.1 two-component sensor histidine kinase [Gemmata obscuriglobus]QEG27556.1 Sporulation kinase A [Gemmata obscuriglobus]VTS04631.1 histidine kinase : Histidine kinase OS=Singulisphaera acidiphila (strain ATCC BAA-1392 / DSM 18658 / VKM B-2454 / MOB10) GN=Sinac_0783 PE=4 SV=1: HisKA: HATPase_c [Gemmata obscuriglobus UQM 2246]